MTNEFAENNKFLGLQGTLNRRGFITNFLIVEILEAILYSTPLLYLLFLKPDILSSFMTFTTQSSGAIGPKWFTIWISIAGAIELCLLYPSFVRRIKDITGESDNNGIITLCMVFLALGYLINIPIVFVNQILKGITFFILIYMMCKRGKISGEKPASEVIKFNWGAMFGTWIWGLINKAPVTLFAIPLFFTTGLFPFMILCGIKGNEWAYAKTDKTVEEFHKNQSTQTAWFVTLMPIVFIIGTIISLIVGGVGLYKYFENNPAAQKSLKTYSIKMINASVESHFDKIELKDDEYAFYINPVTWDKLPKSGKKNLFLNTENYIFMKFASPTKKSSSPLELSGKIKIYSTFNNELLAQRIVNIEEYEKALEQYKNNEISSKEHFKIVNGGYEFNENPTLP